MVGAKSVRVSIRLRRELLDAAKEQTGIRSTTELVNFALASIAARDPVTRYMLLNYGALGPDHSLEY